MRDAARALDDVSDHLGEVLRRADELLAEWSRLGVQVRAQVEREVAAIGEVVDGAVARAAGSGIDRAIAERLRALTAEIDRLEQRTRAASRAVAEHREGDRRVLWSVVAGVVVANALLVALLLRKPEAAPVAEPIRIETPAAPPAPVEAVSPSAVPAGAAGAPSAGSADPAGATGNAGSGAAAAAPGAGSNTSAAGANGPGGGAAALGAGSAAKGASASPTAAAKPGSATGTGAAKASQPAAAPSRPAAEPVRLTPSPIALPPRAGSAHGHKKQP
ncbi:MAG: hypothetical protein ACREBE_23600 [bacterium]